MRSYITVLTLLFIFYHSGKCLLEITDCGTELDDNGWTSHLSPDYQQCRSLHYTNTSSYLGNIIDYPDYCWYCGNESNRNFPSNVRRLDGYGIWVVVPTLSIRNALSFAIGKNSKYFNDATSVQLGIRYYVRVDDKDYLERYNNTILYVSPVVDDNSFPYYETYSKTIGLGNSIGRKWSEARLNLDVTSLKNRSISISSSLRRFSGSFLFIEKIVVGVNETLPNPLPSSKACPPKYPQIFASRCTLGLNCNPTI